MAFGDLAVLALPLAAAAGATLAALSVAWISDDAYITARYADNLLSGHGPVFNPGERVQGYSHPAWFLVFTAGLALLKEPLLVAVVLGGFLTFLTMLLACRFLIQGSASPGVAVVAVGAFLLPLALSDSWRSFQTSGLENSLSHLWLALAVIETARRPEPRYGLLSLYAAMLVLTRPDLGALIAPLWLYAFVRAWRQGHLERPLLGVAPLAAWLLFAQLYYGTVMHNPAVTKLGIYPLDLGVEHGLNYVADFAHYEPLTAFAVVCFVALLPWRWGRLPAGQRCLLIGAALYTLSVIVAGGDFMRGRLLLAPILTVALCGSGLLASSLRPTELRGAWLGAAAAAFACNAVLLAAVTPPPDREDMTGVVHERVLYSKQSLAYYLRHGKTAPIDGWLSDMLLRFRAACGPFAIERSQLGAFSYQLGPSVTVIDPLGLTDATIARLPETSITKESRPGHPVRLLPIGYLASRGNIMMFANWQQAVEAGDCRIIAATAAYVSSTAWLNPYDPATRPVYVPP
jgi:arabinofuranosyltransferase